MWKLIIAGVLVFHGIGHVMGTFPVIGMPTVQGQSSHSWLLTNLIGEPAAGWFSVVLWMAAMFGFVGAGLALVDWWLPYEWWRGLAIGSAVISLVALVLYWNAFYTILNRVGALGIDIAVLVALLVMHWPSEALLNT